MSEQEYSRYPVQDTKIKDIGPYEAIVINHLDPYSMGTLEVELMKATGAAGISERSGQLATVRYLSPFFGNTAFRGLTPNDGYQYTQKSYGFWMVPPDPGARVLVIFAEGHSAYGYWIGCIPELGMNFMTPDPRASTTNTTGNIPSNLQGLKLPVGEYNKTIEAGTSKDPTLFPRPYNKDFAETLEVQGLIYDEARGTTTSSARRETPSAVFGISTPGPTDKRNRRPTTKYGHHKEQVDVPYNRLGGSSFVMDDGDDKFIRATHAADGPPYYVNKETGEGGGDETIPQNECMRFRTRTGHQILLHNSEDLIYIANSRGTAWIELTSDGKIDIHADDSISLMTGGDLNITAERDINMEAARNVNIKASGRWADFQKRFFPTTIEPSGVRNGQVTIEAFTSTGMRSGENSTYFEVNDTTVKLEVEEDFILDVPGKFHLFVGSDMYMQVKEDLHQQSRNLYGKAFDTMVLQSSDFYNQIGGDANITIAGSSNETVEGNSNLKIAGDQIISAASIGTTSAGAIGISAGGNINAAGGNVNLQGGEINLNSGSALPAVPTPASASIAITGTSPQTPKAPSRTFKLTTLVGQYILPGEKIPVEYETIIPRAPQHEPWPQHENMDPFAFKKEFTDRERPGELKNADRILTPDTFLKNQASIKQSAVVSGSGGQSSYNVGANENLNVGQPAVGNGPATGTTTPNVSYHSSMSSARKVRNQPIQDRLVQILEAAAQAAKVEVQIYSGGQPPPPATRRTGSRRHDNGYAADVWIYNNGQQLNSANSKHLEIFKTFCRAAKEAGATAIGVGNGYMGNTGIHLDIARGRPGVSAGTVWGGASMSRAGAPSWIVQIMDA